MKFTSNRNGQNNNNNSSTEETTSRPIGMLKKLALNIPMKVLVLFLTSGLVSSVELKKDDIVIVKNQNGLFDLCGYVTHVPHKVTNVRNGGKKELKYFLKVNHYKLAGSWALLDPVFYLQVWESDYGNGYKFGSRPMLQADVYVDTHPKSIGPNPNLASRRDPREENTLNEINAEMERLSSRNRNGVGNQWHSYSPPQPTRAAPRKKETEQAEAKKQVAALITKIQKAAETRKNRSTSDADAMPGRNLEGHNLKSSYRNNNYAESMQYTRNILKEWQQQNPGKIPRAFQLISLVNQNSQWEIDQDLAMKVINELRRRRLSVSDRLAEYEQHF